LKDLIMTKWILALMAAVFVTAMLPDAADARSPRNPDRWDFKVRNNPFALARANTLWQVREADRAREAQQARQAAAADDVFIADTFASGDLAASSTLQSSPYGSYGAGGTLLPNATSVGNMNIVTVTVYEGGRADVAVEAEQENLGKIESDATAVSGETNTVTGEGVR
jgi:hypothetical protein